MLGKGLGLWALPESAPRLTPHCTGTYSDKAGFHDKPAVEYTILVKSVDKGFTLQQNTITFILLYILVPHCVDKGFTLQ
jgi:hypothetical protein